MDFTVLQELSEAELQELVSSLRDGPLSKGISHRVLQAVAGIRASDLLTCFQNLQDDGLTTKQVALVVEAARQAKGYKSPQNQIVDLVLSGPGVEEVPMGNTSAQMHSLVMGAKHQLLFVGYAVHDGKQIFKTLSERMDDEPDLSVTFCLDIKRKFSDERQPEELIVAFRKNFIKNEWPGTRLPKVYCDPRSLQRGRKRACLHAKVVVVDQLVTLITSANFTEAAQERNIELGAVIRIPEIGQRVHQHFSYLIEREALFPVIS